MITRVIGKTKKILPGAGKIVKLNKNQLFISANDYCQKKKEPASPKIY